MKQVKLAASLFLLSQFALAQNLQMPLPNQNEPYTYLSFGLGLGEGAKINYISDVDRELAGVAQLGYQFNQNWALEADAVGINDGLIFGGDVDIYALAVKSLFPMPHRFTFFAKLGPAYLRTYTYYQAFDGFYDGAFQYTERQRATNDAGLFIGAGASKSFAKHWATSLEYNAAYANTSYIHGLLGAITFNVTYKFN